MTEVSNEWREASDWDNPWEVAILYRDAQQLGCGHAVQWAPHKLIDLKNCPVCGEPVTMICDGSQRLLASSAHTKNDDDNSDGLSDMNKSNFSKSPSSCVWIKFGRKTYLLSLERPSSETASSEIASSNFLRGWIERVLLLWNPPSSSMSSKYEVLVQDRLRAAFCLNKGFKILHQGKIVYPPPRLPSVPRETARGISDRLLEISRFDLEKQHASISSTTPGMRGKASLVLMGTPEGRELRDPPKDTSILWTWTWYQWLQLPPAIVYWVFHSLLMLGLTFVEPLLPASWAPTNRGVLASTSNASPQRGDLTSRPHED